MTKIATASEIVIDPETLRELGGRAAALYFDSGHSIPLTDAVATVLKDYPSTDDHVQRVVEHANHAAFAKSFRDTEGDHRLINFVGGPALTDDVMSRLSRKGGDAVVKIADGRRAIRGFHDESEWLSNHNEGTLNDEYGDAYQLKLAHDELGRRMAVSRDRFEKASANLVKAASDLIREGYSPAVITQVISRVSPADEFTKLAMKTISGALVQPRFAGREKIASGDSVNFKHPLVLAFEVFVKEATAHYTDAEAESLLSGAVRQSQQALKEMRCHQRTTHAA